METERIPWLFALLTAAWFGWMARRATRSFTLWAVGGAAFGLVASTLVLGLGQASSIPFSQHEQTATEFKWLIAAVLLIAFIGWLLTSGLHRHHRLLLHRKMSAESAAANGPNPSPAIAPQTSRTPPEKS